MSEPTLNSPIPFDPVVSALPDGVLLPPERGGEVVALLVDPGIGLAGWPLRVARALARGWSARERTVVLVDAHIRSPSLHQLLNAENAEGLTDAIEYGASAERVTQALSDEPFVFVSAGTVLSDQPGFWRSRRWGALLDSLRAGDRVVLLYLPAGDPEVGAVVRESDRAFWIGRAEAPDASSYGEMRAIVPPATGEGAAQTGDPSTEVGERHAPPRGLIGATQDSLAEKPEVEAERRAIEQEAVARKDSPAGKAGRPRTAAPRPKGGARPVGKRRAMPWLLLGLLLVLAGAVIGHWYGIYTIPGLPVRMDPAVSVLQSFSLSLRVPG